MTFQEIKKWLGKTNVDVLVSDERDGFPTTYVEGAITRLDPNKDLATIMDSTLEKGIVVPFEYIHAITYGKSDDGVVERLEPEMDDLA